MMSNNIMRYNRAYAEIGAKTPIPADCGKLCDARCCKGDNHCGMIVFPGEEQILSAHGFPIVSKNMHGYPISFTTCNGHCRRIFRPLSCRIFPLVPNICNNVLSITEDPRAKLLCPLLSTHTIDQSFYNAVYQAFLILIDDPLIQQMLVHYTAMLDEYRSFWGE